MDTVKSKSGWLKLLLSNMNDAWQTFFNCEYLIKLKQELMRLWSSLS